MAEETLKLLRSDDNDPLFDKTNMLKKEFPSDFRQIRYFTLLIVQAAPAEIKDVNLLEQQISEVIKNAVKHGNNCDVNKKVTVWYSFSPTHAHLHSRQRKAMSMTAETLCSRPLSIGTAVLFTTERKTRLPCLSATSKSITESTPTKID